MPETKAQKTARLAEEAAAAAGPIRNANNRAATTRVEQTRTTAQAPVAETQEKARKPLIVYPPKPTGRQVVDAIGMESNPAADIAEDLGTMGKVGLHAAGLGAQLVTAPGRQVARTAVDVAGNLIERAPGMLNRAGEVASNVGAGIRNMGDSILGLENGRRPGAGSAPAPLVGSPEYLAAHRRPAAADPPAVNPGATRPNNAFDPVPLDNGNPPGEFLPVTGAPQTPESPLVDLAVPQYAQSPGVGQFGTSLGGPGEEANLSGAERRTRNATAFRDFSNGVRNGNTQTAEVDAPAAATAAAPTTPAAVPGEEGFTGPPEPVIREEVLRKIDTTSSGITPRGNRYDEVDPNHINYGVDYATPGSGFVKGQNDADGRAVNSQDVLRRSGTKELGPRGFLPNGEYADLTQPQATAENTFTDTNRQSPRGNNAANLGPGFQHRGSAPNVGNVPQRYLTNPINFGENAGLSSAQFGRTANGSIAKRGTPGFDGSDSRSGGGAVVGGSVLRDLGRARDRALSSVTGTGAEASRDRAGIERQYMSSLASIGNAATLADSNSAKNQYAAGKDLYEAEVKAEQEAFTRFDKVLDEATQQAFFNDDKLLTKYGNHGAFKQRVSLFTGDAYKSMSSRNAKQYIQQAMRMIPWIDVIGKETGVPMDTMDSMLSAMGKLPTQEASIGMTMPWAEGNVDIMDIGIFGGGDQAFQTPDGAWFGLDDLKTHNDLPDITAAELNSFLEWTGKLKNKPRNMSSKAENEKAERERLRKANNSS